MNIAIRYFSRSGNTKLVADEIAHLTSSESHSIDTPIEGCPDVLFVGGGTYPLFTIDKHLKEWLMSLNQQSAKLVVGFCTCGGVDSSKKIVKYASKAGLEASQERFVIKGCRGKLELTDGQKQEISDFVKKVLEQVK